jgi:microsomal dipeptidase-like Zn-dependent dipeptidase
MLIDALQCGRFDPAVLEDLRAGGISCVTSTLGFWEGTLESLDEIGRWRDMARECEEMMVIARCADDILKAHAAGKIAVLLGFQNINLLEGRIRYVELFADLGVRVLQLTYNNQNDAGGSCYETVDAGLTRFGREVVREMNRVGMLIDLSHVGERTTLDAIAHSQKPVAITHANAASVMPHPRNKSDAVLKELARRGGVIGCATYRNFTPDAACESVNAWAAMVARTVDIAGIDHVGIGTDEIHQPSQAALDWMRQGRWTRSVQYGAGSATRAGQVAPAAWLPRPAALGVVVGALAEVGFRPEDVRKITAGNWLRLYRESIG